MNANVTAQIELPAGVEGHFRLHVYATVTRILANIAALDGEHNLLGAFPFLAGYDAALRACRPAMLPDEQADGWWTDQIVAWERETPEHLPLRALREELDLDGDALLLFIAAGLVEEDMRFGELFAALHSLVAPRRPTLGILGWLLATPGAPPTDVWPWVRTLIHHGLVLAENQNDPRAEWALRVPPAIWDAVRQPLAEHVAPQLQFHRAGSFPTLDALVLAPSLHNQLMQLPALLVTERMRALVLRGMRGSGRRTVAGSLARALGRDLLVWQGDKPDDPTLRLLGPLATLAGSLPLLRCNPNAGETLDLAALPGYSGPVVVALGTTGGLVGQLVDQSIMLHIPLPDAAARRTFWRAADIPLADAELPDIAARFQLNAGHIRRAAPLAAAYATLTGAPHVRVEHIQHAARSLNRQALETLATALEPLDGWDALVVGPSTAEELRGLEARCRVREHLQHQAGRAFGGSLNRGVRAMFTGPSGTGKTLAARALAGALQMDVYRVDLAAVVNKYIGETERNLNQVLSRAEELDILLLLDEGDALMTTRTEVRSANDRYANLETNYLLQRLESYEGIVVITTNASQRIDGAFLRRLDVTVEFVPPEASERRRIWELHLPANHETGALLDEVAARCMLSGGQIRNAALHATLLALSENSPLSPLHLEAALLREYRKAGASYPLRTIDHAPGQMQVLRQFAGQLG